MQNQEDIPSLSSPTFMDYGLVTVRSVDIIRANSIPDRVLGGYTEIGGYSEAEPSPMDDLEFIIKKSEDSTPNHKKTPDFYVNDLKDDLVSRIRKNQGKEVSDRNYIYSSSDGQLTRTRNFSDDIKRILTQNTPMERYIRSLRSLISKDVSPSELIPPGYWRRDDQNDLGLSKVPATTGLWISVVPISNTSGTRGNLPPRKRGSADEHTARIVVYRQGNTLNDKRHLFYELVEIGNIEVTGRRYNSPFDPHMEGYKREGISYLISHFPLIKELMTSSETLWSLKLVKDTKQRNGNINLHYTGFSGDLIYRKIRRTMAKIGFEQKYIKGQRIIGEGDKQHLSVKISYLGRIDISVDVYRARI